MLGLGAVQLILILAGLCFIVAGIYGLAPNFKTARPENGPAASAENKPTQLSRKQARKAAEAARLASLKPPAQHKQHAPAPAEALPPPPAPPSQESAPVALLAAAEEPPAKPAPASEIAAPVAMASTDEPPTMRPSEAVGMDQELVDDLFVEMFALRSTVAGLVNEVHELRSEHRPRRFVIEEVPG